MCDANSKYFEALSVFPCGMTH